MKPLRRLLPGLLAGLLAACGDSAMGPSASGGLGDEMPLAVGTEHNCLVGSAGQALCWGWGRLGQLGTGDTLNRSLPAPVLQGQLRFTSITAGGNHSCALTEGGEAYCWGSAFSGELGNGTMQGRVTSPTSVLGDQKFRLVTAGDGHTCALGLGGEAYCWGSGIHGQLGGGETTDVVVPTAVATELRFRNVSAGLEFTCGVAMDLRAFCWGSNIWGQLGTGQAGGGSAVPVAVVGALVFDTVAVGNTSACGLSARAAYCWGLGSFGRLGDGAGGDSIIAHPVPVAGALSFRRVSVGADHSCAVTASGHAYCWGLNNYGKLGNPGPPESRVPSLVEGGLDFVWIGAGQNHSCGMTRSGRGYCWGRNSVGQLGQRAPPWSSALPIEFQLD